MQTLSSICDTFSPSIDPPSSNSTLNFTSAPAGRVSSDGVNNNNDISAATTKNVFGKLSGAGNSSSVAGAVDFYRCSASDLGVPADVS